MANHLYRSWRIVENAGAAHRRSVNSILGLLCKDHFPSLVEYAGVVGPTYTFDQYAATPNTEDRDGMVFNNKSEQVKQELWVSATYIAIIANS
jgi:hypothetical protein